MRGRTNSALIRRCPCLQLINHFSGEESFKSMNFQFSYYLLNRRCALSLLGREHTVVYANGGYMEE